MRILKDWNSFFVFLKSPQYDTPTLATKDKFWLSLNLFILQLILMIGVLLLIHLLTGGGPQKQLDISTAFYKVIALVLFAGIFEELVFRLLLTKYNSLYLSTFCSGIFFIAIKKIFFHNMLLDHQGLLTSAAIALLCFPVVYFIAQKNEEALDRFWKKHFPFVFYFSAVLFALSHFFNNEELHLSALKFNSIQLIAALGFGFLRIRAGLVFAIALHIIFDLLVV